MTTRNTRSVAAIDAFMFVAEHRGLLRTVSEFTAIEAEITSWGEKAGVSPDEVTLGLIYTKRVHSIEPLDELLQQVDELISRQREDDRMALTGRVVKLTLLCVRGRMFASLKDELSEVADKARDSGRDFLHGVARRMEAIACMWGSDLSKAGMCFEEAAVAFRRCDARYHLVSLTNDYGVFRKACGSYEEALIKYREAYRMSQDMGTLRLSALIIVNQAVALEHMGLWAEAEKRLLKGAALIEQITGASDTSSVLYALYNTNLGALHLRQRKFALADERISGVLRNATVPRDQHLARQLLGELQFEIGDNRSAERWFDRALEPIVGVPVSRDLEIEVIVQRAEVYLKCERYDEARASCVTAVRMAKVLCSPLLLGDALRVLGDVYSAIGDRRALRCLEMSIVCFRQARDCFQLMRALLSLSGVANRTDNCYDAELALLEARQLSRKLELSYYQARIAMALVDLLASQQRFDEASSWLREAMTLRDTLEGVDRKRVDEELERVANDLQIAITRASVQAAETLKTICRVYEDARFPFEEMKPDLAYQVAQSVGAECLFVIGRRGGGYHVPLTYNISVNEAKELVRLLDRGPKKALLGVMGEPRVMVSRSRQTLVAVPCVDVAGNREKGGYLVCTRFERIVTITPRQIEILCASAEALARLVEEEELRRTPAVAGEEGEPIRVTHPRGSFKDILTIDPDMIRLIRTAELAAGSVAPILLEGETGSGKELFARAIHGSSRRRDGAFVAVNAGGMSLSLLESELFGHVKGAFTDAGSDRVGLVETARGGTLFLDEVGEMSEELQVKLLRLLENGEYRRLGESAVRKADVRIVSATNRDLKQEVEEGRFRRDLYYRLSPVRLEIPSLRMRSCDIQLMVRHFLRECAAANGIADRYIEIDVKAMEALELYNWPGNVRELHNEILRVVSLIGNGDLVRFTMLSENIKDYLRHAKRGTDGLLERSVEQYERRLILHALNRNDWNRMRTADSVGVPRTTLLAKLKRLNVASK